MKDKLNITYIFIAFVFVICAAATLMYGEISWQKVYQGALKRIAGIDDSWNPLLDERLPRLIVIICTGASLAVCGIVTQSLFQNPLAAPSILGINAGGSLAVLTVFIAGIHSTTPYAIPLAAFLGCLLSLILVCSLARHNGSLQFSELILTGIAISTLLLAIQALLMYALRHNWQLVQTLTEWEAGSTLDRNWKHVHMQLPLTIIGLWGCWHYRHEIDIIALGEEEALNLGVDVLKVRWRLILCIAILTGGALAAVGSIPFYGLILPHLVRRLYGTLHGQLIPLCLFGGGVVLLFMDISIRLLSVQSLTLGNVSAIIGGAFFLMLLQEKRQQNAVFAS